MIRKIFLNLELKKENKGNIYRDIVCLKIIGNKLFVKIVVKVIF